VNIVRRLRDSGHESYLAGGCVRDELLGLEPKDFDVATDAPPERVAELFRRTREVGRAFGVMHVTSDRVVTEVATFRTEGSYTDKRRPDAVTFASAEEDAQRRDFTVNALFIDPLDESERAGGRVIDFVGGVEDLGKKVIRAVGDADERLAEDDLRSLRAVRFAARLGFEIERSTRDAITQHAGELIGISRERIGDELRAMLAHPTRARAIGLVHELRLEAAVLLLPSIEGVRWSFLNACDEDAPPMVALGAWCVDRTLALEADNPEGAPGRLAAHAADTVRALRKALVLSNDETAQLNGMLRGFNVLVHEWDSMRVAHQKRAASSSWFEPVLGLLSPAWGALAGTIRGRILELSGDPIGLSPEPVLTGDDLIDRGFTPGPSFKGWLEEAYNLQLEGAIASQGEAITKVQSWAASDTNKD